MESAIPAHLRCPRTRPARASETYEPPYPAWVARLRPQVKQVVMAYFGVQCREPGEAPAAFSALKKITGHFHEPSGPPHHDLAMYVDEAGFTTYVAIAYWESAEDFQAWAGQSSMNAWWQSEDRLSDGLGYFKEVFCPRASHFETLFSTLDRFEGAALMAESLSGEIQEHGYWGAARDRLPASQYEAMESSGTPSVDAAAPRPGSRVRVKSHDNVALIRSGQEWTETAGKERQLYLSEVEPILLQGMQFLRDKGGTIGCYFNRYMVHVNGEGIPIEKSFGMSCWKSLEHLERWAESHPTHIAIFGTFMRVVQEMNFDLRLRLYHEVSVARADEQVFEYINCHPKTGLLRAASDS
jgi:aldoxime dehydratase